MDDFGFEDYGYETDDLEALGQREAWEDGQAEATDWEDEDEDDDRETPDDFDRRAESVLFPWLDNDCLADMP